MATKKAVVGRSQQDLRIIGHEAVTGPGTETETALGMADTTIAVMGEAAELQRLSAREIVSVTGNGDGAVAGLEAAVAGAVAILTAKAAAAGCHQNHRHQHVVTRSPAQLLTEKRHGLCSVAEQRTMMTKGSNHHRRTMTDHQVSLVEAAPRSPRTLRRLRGPRSSGPQVSGTQTRSQMGHLCLHSPCPLQARLRQGGSQCQTKMPTSIRRLRRSRSLGQTGQTGQTMLSTTVRSRIRCHHPSS